MPLPLQGFINRKSLRIKGFDYSQPGYYFITLNTYHRSKIFGYLSNGEIVLSKIGQIVESEWNKLPFRFKGLELDASSIMPDHFHGSFFLHDQEGKETERCEAFSHPVKGSLPTIVRSFKSSVSIRVHQIITSNIEVWQRNYYEEYIEDEERIELIRDYILGNHAKG